MRRPSVVLKEQREMKLVLSRGGDPPDLFAVVRAEMKPGGFDYPVVQPRLGRLIAAVVKHYGGHVRPQSVLEAIRELAAEHHWTKKLAEGLVK